MANINLNTQINCYSITSPTFLDIGNGTILSIGNNNLLSIDITTAIYGYTDISFASITLEKIFDKYSLIAIPNNG